MPILDLEGAFISLWISTLSLFFKEKLEWATDSLAIETQLHTTSHVFFCFMWFLNKRLIKVFQKMLEWNNFQKIFVKFMFPFKLNLVLKQIIRCVVFMIKKLLFWCLRVLLILLTWLFFCKYDAYVYQCCHEYSDYSNIRIIDSE